MAKTVFQKIMEGSLPCYRLYEDGDVLAFLDLFPLAPGHALVVPKEPAPTLDLLSDHSAAAIGRILPRLCRAIIRETGASDYHVLQNNGSKAHQAIHHVHFHIIPKLSQSQGLGLIWEVGSLDPVMAEEMAKRIHTVLSP